MKKFMLLIMVLLTASLAACDAFGDAEEFPYDENVNNELYGCNGYKDFVVIDGVCIPIPEILSEQITINETVTEVRSMQAVELMNNFVADLSGSTGLAVVNRELFEEGMPESNVDLAGEISESTENILAKLNEDGFFEEVSFSDDQGLSVEIKSNPLAIEVYGEFTVVIFEVDLGNENENQEFTQRLYNALYAGGIYLIHNETGKLFATKEVEFNEYHYSEYEDHSRMVNLLVTLNQPIIEYIDNPIYDELGEPVLDQDGNMTFETTEQALLDSEGNPVILTEGPILMQTIESPVFNYYEEASLDENGDQIFDENGKAVFTIVEEPVLDENGVQLVEVQELPVLDENGDLTYEQEFYVEFYIEDHREIIVTEYSADVVDNALSSIAQKFVDRIMEEYYNWQYYRVSNYHLQQYSFASNQNAIYYIEWTYGDGPDSNEQMLKRLSFDNTDGVILLEDFLNLSVAGFDQCELIIDPLKDNVICNQSSENIKIYSATNKLKTIPNTDTLQPIAFPNGELYFFDYQDSYIEELGYYSTLLYTINDDGTLDSSYVELGERINKCTDNCQMGMDVKISNLDGLEYSTGTWVNVQVESGQGLLKSADLQLTNVSDFDASRSVCTESNGCDYYTTYEFLNIEGEVVGRGGVNSTYSADDELPNFVERYQITEDTTLIFSQENTDKVCDNVLGCVDQVGFSDPTMNVNGLWMWNNTLLGIGDKFTSQIDLKENNNAVYVYEQTYNGTVCENPTCTTNVNVYFFDEDGERFDHRATNMSFVNGDTIPLRLEYHLTADTSYTYTTDTCTDSEGCYSGFYTDEDIYFSIIVDNSSLIPATITFAETDKATILNETIVQDYCDDLNGCYFDESVYQVVDDEGNILYEFTNGYNVEFGYKAAYKVTMTLDDVNINMDQTNQDKICDETSCYNNVEILYDNGEGNAEHLMFANMYFDENETVINSMVISADDHHSFEDENMCTNENGCSVRTNDFFIVDDEGTEYQYHDDSWYDSIYVPFAYGDKLPSENNFVATFEMQNIEYQTSRIYIGDFIYNMQNVIVLDENLYLIENNSWNRGDDNLILEFNAETQHYSVKYTNMHAVIEITEFENGYIAINDDETGIISFIFNDAKSSEDYYFFDVEDLTAGLEVNEVNDLIVDYDGSIYFKGINSDIQRITGSINDAGEIQIDTEYVERAVVRIRPIN